MNNMIIRKASFNDLQAIQEVYKEAVKHMIEEGNVNQWNNYNSFEKGVIKYIDDDCFYVVENNEEIIGIFALIYGIDKTYNDIRYGNWLNNDEYVTIHKIASKYYRRHIASFILSYVEQTIANKGIKNIRIDTHIDNVSMNAFLLKNGFVKCGTISITCNFEDKNSLRIAYQKVCN